MVPWVRQLVHLLPLLRLSGARKEVVVFQDAYLKLPILIGPVQERESATDHTLVVIRTAPLV